MTDEKLISDALTAFADREIPAPSREDLAIALAAFEASLTRCGCVDCTAARRERIALSEHDRTSLARVLHQIVYSPGANYDRAVPGVQEHMLACAEKVAAALPWITLHTPTDDEREALAKDWADKGFPETPLAPENERLADGAYEAFCAGYDAGFRRSSAEGWSAEDRREALAEGLRRWSVQSQHDRVEQRDHDLYGMGARQGFALGAEWWKASHPGAEPQGEPSDAQRYRAAIEDALPMIGLLRAWNTSPAQIENVRVILARALDAAGGVR